MLHEHAERGPVRRPRAQSSILSRGWRYIIAPHQDRPIALKTLLPDELCCELLNMLAMRSKGRHGILIVGIKVIPQRLIGDGTLNLSAIDACWE